MDCSVASGREERMLGGRFRRPDLGSVVGGDTMTIYSLKSEINAFLPVTISTDLQDTAEVDRGIDLQRRRPYFSPHRGRRTQHHPSQRSSPRYR